MLLSCLLVAAMPVDGSAPGWSRFGGPQGDFRLPAPPAASAGKLRWRRPLGWGCSALISDGQRLYTSFSEPIDKTSAREFVVALDLATGAEAWRRGAAVKFRGTQQTHEEPIQPLATPLLHAGGLFALSFDGVLRRHAPADGAVQWEVDLVAAFGATPVQYGFAASPVPLGDAVLVAAGGAQTHLVALRADTGQPLWKSPADEPGYGTPVVCELAGRRQAVVFGRDALCGYDVRNGAALWRQTLPKPGLTNVPTPLVLGGDRVLVSGQGCDGTRCYRIEASGGAFVAKELWHTPRSRFFYCNWVEQDGFVYGFDTSFFVGLDTRDGTIAWKNRQQTDANVVRLGDRLLALRADGLLTLGAATPKGFAAERRALALPDGHCWTPPTVLDGVAYVRNGKEVAALELGALTAAAVAPPAPEASAMDAALEKWSGKPQPKAKTPAAKR